MATAVSRRQFLRGDRYGRHQPLRPPWGLPEPDFVARCTRCGDCLPACTRHIIALGSGGFPEIDFSRGECSFCAECVAVCRSGALHRDAEALPWQMTAALGETCLAQQRVVCRSCGDVCPPGAIRFDLQPGGIAWPRLERGICTGCGACYGVCPSGAIEMQPAPSLASA